MHIWSYQSDVQSVLLRSEYEDKCHLKNRTFQILFVDPSNDNNSYDNLYQRYQEPKA